MPNTYTLIASSTVGSGGSTQIDFTSIASTYTDLCIKISTRNSNNNYGGFYMRFNSNSTGYTARRLKQEGSTAGSDTSIEIPWGESTWTASTFGNTEIYIPNYAGSNNKSVSIDAVTENNATTNRNTLNAWLWSNTAAITSVSFGTFDLGFPDKFVEFSTFYLYGIVKS
jgi:hypothetical protein